MRSRYRLVEDGGIYFLTATIVEWIPVFTSSDTFGIMLAALAYCRANKGLRLYGYVIMDNHIHLVAQAPDLSRVMQSLKRHTAGEIIDWAQRTRRSWLLSQFALHKAAHKTSSTYQVWQEGSHPQLIQGDDMLRQKLEYMHNNPVRRGYVDAPELWRFSSARNYLCNDHSVLQIDELPE